MSTPASPTPYISPELQKYIEYLQSELLVVPSDIYWAPLISDAARILNHNYLYRRYAAFVGRSIAPNTLTTMELQNLKLLFLSFLATAPADFFIHFLSDSQDTSALTPWISDPEHYKESP